MTALFNFKHCFKTNLHIYSTRHLQTFMVKNKSKLLHGFDGYNQFPTQVQWNSFQSKESAETFVKQLNDNQKELLLTELNKSITNMLFDIIFGNRVD